MQPIINALTPMIGTLITAVLAILLGLLLDASRKALASVDCYLQTKADKEENEYLRAAARTAAAWVEQTQAALNNPDKLKLAVTFLENSLRLGDGSRQRIIAAVEEAVKDIKMWAPAPTSSVPESLPLISTGAPTLLTPPGGLGS